MTDTTDSTADSERTDSCTTTEQCAACEHEIIDDAGVVTIDETEYRVCTGCRDHLRDEIENYFWFDRITETHYEKAASYLRSLDEVWCVKDQGYPGGELWVHTPYCNAAVVGDVCDHFDLKICWFGIASAAHGIQFDCVGNHGPCVEILLTPETSPQPLPLAADVVHSHSDVEWLDELDRLF